METEDRFGWYTITIITGAIVTWLITWPINNMIDKYATKVFLPSFNKQHRPSKPSRVQSFRIFYKRYNERKEKLMKTVFKRIKTLMFRKKFDTKPYDEAFAALYNH